MESAAQSRLVAVSSSRLTEALARWWSLEKSFLDTVGRLAAEPPLGSILERERTQLDGLRAVMRAGLPHRRVDGPVTPRGRQTARRQPTLTLLELKRGLLDENQTVAAEVSNLCDLFVEWERDDLATLMSRALATHRRLACALEPGPDTTEAEAATGSSGPATADAAAATGPSAHVRFIAGVARGPISPWGQRP